MTGDLFVERMIALDPKYGTQSHQREFVARMQRMQELQPCRDQHEHRASCYSAATVRAAERGA